MSLEFKCPKCDCAYFQGTKFIIRCDSCDWTSDNIADGFKHQPPNALDWAVEMEVSDNSVDWRRQKVIMVHEKGHAFSIHASPNIRHDVAFQHWQNCRPIQAEKPKTKRYMTRYEVLDFIFENRDKQMWVKQNSVDNCEWVLPSLLNYKCTMGSYQYTLDKGYTIHKFEVEE